MQAKHIAPFAKLATRLGEYPRLRESKLRVQLQARFIGRIDRGQHHVQMPLTPRRQQSLHQLAPNSPPPKTLRHIHRHCAGETKSNPFLMRPQRTPAHNHAPGFRN